MAADRVTRWTTAGAVLGVAAVDAVASYQHAYDLVRMHGDPDSLHDDVLEASLYVLRERLRTTP